MEPILAAWMIDGGPRIEIPSERRDREQLHAFRESQRNEQAPRRTFVQRLLGLARAPRTTTDLACCPA